MVEVFLVEKPVADGPVRTVRHFDCRYAQSWDASAQ